MAVGTDIVFATVLSVVMSNTTVNTDIATLTAQVENMTVVINCLWVTVCTFFIFVMQAGFAMLEAGTVREKNVQGNLVKNLLDTLVTTVTFFFIGYGLGFGNDVGGFLGSSLFAADGFEGTDNYYLFVFHWSFASTAATIISGSLAERTHILAYLIFSAFTTAITYPVAAHWVFGGGWLSSMGFHDFAGDGPVHLLGGIAGFVGCLMVGPRKDRFTEGRADEFGNSSAPLVVLGTLLLWFGWYGFNCGSTLAFDNDYSVPKVTMNTTLGASAGGLVSFYCDYLGGNRKSKYRITPITNGILAGLVSITGGCDVYTAYSAILVGGIGGIVLSLSSYLLVKYKVDDPLDATSVHGACGVWGLVAIGLFSQNNGIFYGDNGKQLGIQLLGTICIGIWSAAMSAGLYVILRHYNILRTSKEEEEKGMDQAEFGNSAYALNSKEMMKNFLLRFQEF